MKYNSVSSGRMKDYVVHPYRLAFAQGGLYLLAYVPDYKDVRTFAIDRIAVCLARQADVHAERATIPDDVFGNSLGVNTGPASKVEIEFDTRVAPYVRARVWHPSQTLREARRRRPRADARRLPRHGAAKLDSELGRIRPGARRRPSLAADDPRRSHQRNALNTKADVPRRPLRLVAPRRVRAAVLRPGRRSSASTPTGSGSARSAISRSSDDRSERRRRSSRSPSSCR